MANVGSDFVHNLLEHIDKKDREALEIVQLKKECVSLDLGNCLLIDSNPLDASSLKNEKEDYLLKLGSTNGQFILNALSDLDRETLEGFTIVKSVEGSTPIPRAMPIPKTKAPTKWEQFAKEKGIQRKKKEKMVWDDVSKSWKPRYGYRRIDSDQDKWIVEIPQNKDENTDMFAEMAEAKRERVAKNEFQRLRNIARANKIKAAGMTPVLPRDGVERETRDEVMDAAAVARVSTASLGKFDRKLTAGLAKVEDKMAARTSTKKRKFEPNNQDIGHEREKYTDILNKLEKGEKIDGNRALNILSQKKISTAPNSEDKKTKGKDRKSKKGKKAGRRVSFHNKAQQKKKQMPSFKGKPKGKGKKGK